MPKRDNLLDQGEQEKSPNTTLNNENLGFVTNSTDNDNLEEWMLDRREDRSLKDEKKLKE